MAHEVEPSKYCTVTGSEKPCACTLNGKRGDYEVHTAGWCFDMDQIREMRENLDMAKTRLLRIADLGCQAVDPAKRPCGLCAPCYATPWKFR